MRKSTLLIIISTFLVLFGLYSFAWIYSSRLIEDFLQNNPSFAGKKMELSGYPLDVRFKIHYNTPEESKNNIDTIIFNLFLRKVSLISNIDTGTIPPSSENVEVSIKNSSDFVFYFKLHDYFKTINYIKNHKDLSSPMDLFNLTQNIGLESVVSIDHKKESSAEIVDLLVDIGIPDKKTYENFDDLINDIPHHLTSHFTAKVHPLTKEDTQPFLKKFHNLIYPASFKINFDISLPDKSFVASDFIHNLKNIALNIDYSNTTLMNNSKGHISINNTSDLMKINLDASSFYSKKYFHDFNKTISKDDFFEIIKYTANMYNFNLTNVQTQKLHFLVDMLFAEPYSPTSDSEVKSHFDMIIPHEDTSSNHAQYNLRMWDNIKYFDLNLNGELESLNLSSLPKNTPKTHGTLYLKDSKNVLATLGEATNLFILFSVNEVTPELFHKRLTHLEENVRLIADFEKSVSDDPTSEEMRYSYDVDFDPLKILESKISTTNTLSDVLKKFDILATKFVTN